MTIYRPGDIVRIVKYSNEYDDWVEGDMDETIGRTGLVRSLNGGEYLNITTWDEDDEPITFYYEDQALELETDPDRLEFARLKIEDGYGIEYV